MLRPYARRAIQWAGLTDVARRALLAVSGSERTVAVDGAEATFEQRDFGDYIELNQVGAESDVLTRLRSEVRPDDVFLDVGSNLGTFAAFVGDRIDDGYVVAVEPVPSTAGKLAANLRRNDVQATVCRVVFSDAPGTATMTVPDAHGSSSVDVGGEDAAAASDGPAVDAVVGDSYLREHDLPLPTVVKVDVEGHEAAVLRGLEATLSRPACRLVYCEVHGDGAAGDAAVATLLEAYGFALETIAELPGGRRIVRASRD